MKKLYIFLLMIIVYCFLAIAMNNKISKEMLEGKWHVEIAEAPYGYQDLILEIKEFDGEYKADILYVISEIKISDREFILKNGKLTGNINMDNEKRIDITIWEDKGEVKGKAEGATIGKFPVRLTRPKEHEINNLTK